MQERVVSLLAFHALAVRLAPFGSVGASQTFGAGFPFHDPVHPFPGAHGQEAPTVLQAMAFVAQFTVVVHLE